MSELSRIPIIELYDNLIVSLQGELSDRLVAQFKQDVTIRIESSKASGLVIDVSGVDIMDTYISRTIHDIGLVSRLMGVETVISGMDPMIAMTLVEMDLSLQGVRAELNLEAALRHLSRRRRLRRLRRGPTRALRRHKRKAR